MRICRLLFFLSLSILLLFILVRPLFFPQLLGIQYSAFLPLTRHPFDWLIHAVIYGMITMCASLFVWELRTDFILEKKFWFLPFFFIVLGIADEVSQLKILRYFGNSFRGTYSHRSASVGDIIADIIGILLSVWLFRIIMNDKHKQKIIQKDTDDLPT